MNSKHLIALAAAALFSQAPAAFAADTTPTVADITQHNDSGKLLVIIKTPSILKSHKSNAAEPDPKEAIEDYEKVLEVATNPQIRAEALRRSADLRLQLADVDGNPDPAELQKAIANYSKLLAEQPHYELNDRVLYQLARAEQGVNQDGPAIEALQRLSREYPNSIRVADGRFRAGELLYRDARYAEAETEYRAVVEHNQSAPFFEPAQYKLGWSLYKQDKYEQALDVFFALLDRDLPAGELRDAKSALESVAAEKKERVGEALHVTGLSFAALGGGTAINQYFDHRREPRFATLLYSSLGDALLEKHRYSEAAGAYFAFVQRHPRDPLAPAFQMKVIAAYDQGGFDAQMVAAKEQYANDYAPGSQYWGSAAPTPEVLAAVRTDFDELGRYYHARAQKRPAGEEAQKHTDFLTAAGWYRRIFTSFPQDPKLAEVNLHLADALYDGGQLHDAAAEYEKTAYSYGNSPQAAEAANAAVQAEEKLAQESAPADRPAALRLAVAGAVKLADTFPQHPQRNLVLTRAAEDLFELKDYPQAQALAARVLQSQPPAPNDLQLQVLAVEADTQFALNQYPQAEAAYTDLLHRQAADSPARPRIVEQLAASIYKQGEAARSAGDLRTAAKAFQRVGEVTPDAKLRANADYDAASAYFELQDWPAAERSLESIRNGDPNNPLLGDVDKKLAAAYQKDGKSAAAGAAYARISQRGGETADTRREAAWLAAQLYDGSGAADSASHAYEAYVASYPQPLDRSLLARRRLADLSHNGLHDETAYTRWLKEIIAAEAAGGGERNDSTRLVAAQAALDLGRLDAQTARLMDLSAPLDKSLARRKAATEAAIDALNRAADYRFADIKTAAAYEIGAVYRDFAEAIVGSQRPGNLKGESLDQYNLLLQEQASAFEDKSIAAHAANLQSMKQGVWNDWIHRSADQLAQLSPAEYGKHEQHDDRYGSLH